MNHQHSDSPEYQSVPDLKPPSRRSSTDGVQLSGDSRTYAVLAHLLGIISGPLGPFIIWIAMKRNSLVEHEAREALNFQITVWLVCVVGAILTLIYIGFLIVVLAMVLNVVFCVIAASYAHSGTPYRYPFSLRLIDSSQ